MKRKLFYIIFVFSFFGFVKPSLAEDAISLKGILNTFQEAKQKNLQKQIKNYHKSSKQILESIKIKGNNRISTSLIKSQIYIREGDVINSFKIDRIIRNIKSLGVFKKVSTSLQGKDKKTLIIKVIENPSIQEIIIKGNTLFSSRKIVSKLVSKQGDIFSLNNIRKDILFIENFYHKKGYKWAKVIETKTPTLKDKRLIYTISEGVLNQIVISGNVKTKDYVILREMNMQIGKPINEKVLTEDLRRIYNLNYFSQLVPDIIPSKKGGYKLKLTVTEKSSGSINFGGGYGQSSGLFGFADLYIDNVAGTGQLLAFRSQFGKYTTYEFKYHNPWMWDKRKAFTFKLWKTFGQLDYFNPLNQTIIDRNEERTGTSVTVGWPLNYHFRTFHSLKVESVLPKDSALYQVVSYTLTLSYDTRDFWQNPLEGEYYSLIIEQGFKPFYIQEAIDFIKYDINLRRFFKTFEKQTIATRLDFGYMSGDLIDKQPYYVGGGTTVRGYNDNTPFAYGNKRILASIEYRFLFNEVFTGLLFIDTGYASNGNIYDFSKFKIGKGIGLRLNTPIGPFRIDFGINDKGEGNFHFNIGHVF